MSKKEEIRIQVRSRKGFLVDASIRGIEELSQNFEQKWLTKQKIELTQSASLYYALQNLGSIKIYFKTFRPNFYRLTFDGVDPLDFKGSLSFGGRFNIGEAQRPNAKKYLGLDAFSSIYGASSIMTIKKELQFWKNGTFFRIISKRKLKLIDLEKTILKIPLHNLRELVDLAPMEADWGMQSVPLPSQVLAAYLKNFNEYEGLFYPSTKYKRGMIFSFFIPKGKSATDFFRKEKI